MEFIEQDIDKAINQKFLKPLDENCKEGIKKLKNSKVKHLETIGLLSQAFKTINNSEKNLKEYNFADACTLLRSTLEYISMAYIIDIDEKTYNEFLILSNNDIKMDRKYTMPNTLLRKFSKKMNKISSVLFYDSTNNEREKIITDLYDLLCKYTHASIVVSVFNGINNKNEQEVLRLILSYNLYFIKIILYEVLNYFNKDKSTCINEDILGVSIFLNIMKICYIIKKYNIDFNSFKDLFYYDTLNSKFYNYYLEQIKNMKEEIEPDINLFKENAEIVEEIIREFIG